MERRLAASYTLRLIGVSIFIYIMVTIDVIQMIAVALTINLWVNILLVLLVIPIMLLKGARWKVIGEGLDLRFTLMDAVDAFCIAQMTSLALPGATGDLIRVPYMRARANPADKTLLSLLIDATVSSIIPYSVAVIVLMHIFRIGIIFETVIIGFLWVIGIYGVFRILKATIWPSLLKVRMNKLLSVGLHENVIFSLPRVIRKIGKRNLVLAFLFSAASWLIYTIQAYILALAMGLPLSWLYVAISLSVTTMLTAIPISILGLGIREGVLMFMFGMVRIDVVIIVAYSITLMLISLTPSVIGAIRWLSDPFLSIDDLRKEDVMLGIDPEPSCYSIEMELDDMKDSTEN